MMLGGIRLAMVAAEAISAAVKAAVVAFALHFRCRASATSTATSAADEPEMPAKNMLKIVTTCARPPRRWPTSVCDSRIMRDGDVGRRHQVADQQEERHREQRLDIHAVEELRIIEARLTGVNAVTTSTEAISAKATGTPM